ncbi:MAG TPA: SAM-dependent methyltransferase [Terriglobales bacterium]|nr:SAM-dependent methyltransferase [Terriglobales bacterium]
MSLRERILEEIATRGPIPFSRYMEMCLYDPKEGYYSRPQEKFGRAGDFYTSSDVHAVFGRLLARQFEGMWRRLGAPKRLDLIELGPGRGLFARDVLDWSRKKFPEFFAALHYRLVEASPILRQGLQERLGESIAQGRVSIAAQPEEIAPAQHAIVFANEFFDALPVELVDARGEVRVDARDGRLVEVFAPPSVEALEYLDHYAVHPEAGERVEAGLEAQRWGSRMARLAERAFFVLIDYGYTREELLAGRHRGTVMAYRRHTASANPYEAPGEQDVTAHVNFTALSGAAREAGLDVLGLVTQSQFLMGIGEENEFADAFEDCRLPQERAKVALQLKHLVSPAGMGESFHVLVLGKGVTKDGIRGLAFARL